MISPFDGRKALYHMQYWSRMSAVEQIPPPLLVTLDPINRCNLSCVWCNSSDVRKRGGAYWAEDIGPIVELLRGWGTQAVCIAGGGEPTLHPNLEDLLARLGQAGVAGGLVTNGTKILAAMEVCRWVSISVDAATAEEYREAKGADLFDQVIDNIRKLRAWAPLLEITYKFLISRHNVKSLARAAQLAEEIGCTRFHARPVGRMWGDPRPNPLFDPEDIAIAQEQAQQARAYARPGFDVALWADKFSPSWDVRHGFQKCRAVGMTCVIQPHTVGLCCDRRGDERVELCSWATADDIRRAWGSERHWQVMREVNPSQCPRCTYEVHNCLYEAFVDRDDACKFFF